VTTNAREIGIGLPVGVARARPGDRLNLRGSGKSCIVVKVMLVVLVVVLVPISVEVEAEVQNWMQRQLYAAR
jgi:hypothetical protein